jgi:S1-C subfamily serine protease
MGKNQNALRGGIDTLCSMFQEACRKNREAIYGIKAASQISENQVTFGTGSGFAIAPGIIATVSHLVHIDNDPNKIHTHFEVIRSPDIGQKMESATLIAEDPNHDIALLKINNPRSDKCVTLEQSKVPSGTSCGSLGFPLGEVVVTGPGQVSYNLVERFQGSFISAFVQDRTPLGKSADFYEIDSLMYHGSSGCPGFLPNSRVVGMQSQSRLGENAAEVLQRAKISQGTGDKKPIVNSQLAISMWVPSMDIVKTARDNGISI